MVVDGRMAAPEDLDLVESMMREDRAPDVGRSRRRDGDRNEPMHRGEDLRPLRPEIAVTRDLLHGREVVVDRRLPIDRGDPLERCVHVPVLAEGRAHGGIQTEAARDPPARIVDGEGLVGVEDQVMVGS